MQPPSLSWLRLSNIYFFLALIVLAGSVVYGILQFQLFQAQAVAIVDNEARISGIQTERDDAMKTYKALAEDQIKKQADFVKRIEAVLPLDENYTDLTRQLDDYFAEHDRPGNVIFQSSLHFGKGEPMADRPDISILSFTMNIEASRDNFFKFLDFVNNSGSLFSGTRLMSINSIQFNFPEGGEVVTDRSQKINFTVDMNAYYQTPAAGR